MSNKMIESEARIRCDTSGTLERYDEMFVPINSVPNNAMI